MNDKIEIGRKNVLKFSDLGSAGLLNGLETVAGDMENYLLEYIFGTLYEREGLDAKTKQVSTLTALAVTRANEQLKFHIKAGLKLGMTQQEIADVFIHVSGYAGFPASLNALGVAKQVFAEISGDA